MRESLVCATPESAGNRSAAQGNPSPGFSGGIRPSGLWVSFLGPDGSGKSSVIARYVPSMEPYFRGVRQFHLRPGLLRGTAAAQIPNTDPHGQEPRGWLASTAKALYFWADYTLGYWFRVRPLLARSQLVVFDRYYHDLPIDARRFRYGGPRWLARLIARLIPLPDLMLVLDAPPDLLQARKQEVTAEESVRQSEAYRAVALSDSVRGRAVLVDASQPLEQVVRDCKVRTLDLLATRTRRGRGQD
ncbi:MAG: hypothetical protein WBE72_06290 [Terracidiphilus sp.]